jgi:hypothetical protein
VGDEHVLGRNTLRPGPWRCPACGATAGCTSERGRRALRQVGDPDLLYEGGHRHAPVTSAISPYRPPAAAAAGAAARYSGKRARPAGRPGVRPPGRMTPAPPGISARQDAPCGADGAPAVRESARGRSAASSPGPDRPAAVRAGGCRRGGCRPARPSPFGGDNRAPSPSASRTPDTAPPRPGSGPGPPPRRRRPPSSTTSAESPESRPAGARSPEPTSWPWSARAPRSETASWSSAQKPTLPDHAPPGPEPQPVGE